MGDSYRLEDGKYGKVMFVKSEWNDELAEVYKQQQVKDLRVNNLKSIAFLGHLTDLHALILIDYKQDDIRFLHNLSELRYLTLNTYAKSPIDLSHFPKLERFGFEWIKRSDSLFMAYNLRSLHLNRYHKKASVPFANLKNLHSLIILNSPLEEVEGFRQLVNLQTLVLGNLRKISTLAPLQNLSNLTYLDVGGCKSLTSLSDIMHLRSLEYLWFADVPNIDSLHGIEKLEKLRLVIFDGKTNILDGDLEPLTRLPNLFRCSFANRKHYNMTNEDIDILTATRPPIDFKKMHE